MESKLGDTDVNGQSIRVSQDRQFFTRLRQTGSSVGVCEDALCTVESLRYRSVKALHGRQRKQASKK